MTLTIEYLGHSGFIFSTPNHTVLIDPFLSGNPLAVRAPADIRCDAVVLTHGHSDHLGDTPDIARGNNATVYANWEICEYLGELGLKHLEPGNPGGQINAPFGFVAFTRADHSSSHAGRYLGNPCGIILRIADTTIYHCGDTGLFSDMKLIGEIYKPDIACIPVGDRFTMGPALASRAAELIRPNVAIPIHYKTFPMLTSDISAFRPDGVEVRELVPGKPWRYA